MKKTEEREFDLDLSLLPLVPSTDSGVIFDITYDNDRLQTPLSTIEFDLGISGIFRRYDPIARSFTLDRIKMIPQERQFLRSFVQIAQDSSGRKSYAFTIDRITYPQFEEGYKLLNVELNNRSHKFMYYDKPSDVLKAIIQLCYLMSSNRHDAVFGYPDPLFEVDQYVKTIGLTHSETLELALTEIDLDEFSVTYRQSRERGGGS